LKIRDGKGKYLERKILKRYVPEEFFERKKQGFSIPVFTWFQQDLDEMFNTHLSRENLQRINILDPDEVHRELVRYKAYKKRGKEYNIEKMWRILSFVLWWEKYMLHAV
jgi:asparagine synthase (glutamine-hydrolysing)